MQRRNLYIKELFLSLLTLFLLTNESTAYFGNFVTISQKNGLLVALLLKRMNTLGTAGAGQSNQMLTSSLKADKTALV